MLTLFVGDKNIVDIAVKHDSSACLINESNLLDCSRQSKELNITAYTSLNDLAKSSNGAASFYSILELADQIFYRPPLDHLWSDRSRNFEWLTYKKTTEYYLYLIDLQKQNVDGLNLSKYQTLPYLELSDTRKETGKTIWSVGCSITHGVGIESDQRYGHLLGAALDLPVCYLTQPGTSIEWAADQILRSDIVAGDLIVWGLTNECRAPEVKNNKVVISNDFELRMHETRLYKSLTCIHQVINFCNKINATLVLLPFMCSENIQLALHHCNNYYQLPLKQYLDLGTDNQHPGAGQHLAWANFCIDLLKDNN